MIDWLIDAWTNFTETLENLSGGDTPLYNLWFWLLYFALLISVWYLPSKIGLADYTLIEKLMYTVLFFIIDYFIISKFMS